MVPILNIGLNSVMCEQIFTKVHVLVTVEHFCASPRVSVQENKCNGHGDSNVIAGFLKALQIVLLYPKLLK